MPTLWLDIETRSTHDLKRVGTDVYARDCEIILFAWALGADDPAQVWEPLASPMPDSLASALSDPGTTIVAHNAYFERTVFRHQLAYIPLDNWHCTMAQALAHSLPGDLDSLGRFLGLPADKQKLKEGKRLIRLFCMPQRKGGFAGAADHFDDWNLFVDYARLDVEAMRECYKRMPKVNFRHRERHIWRIDQMINDRGFAVDRQLAEGAVAALAVEKERINATVEALTGGKIRSATQRDALQTYLRDEHGVALDDMRAKTVRDAAGEASGEALDLLRARIDVSRSSTAKYQRVLDAVSPDGRLRGSMQYCGASRTGRWSGRIFQPLNLPRPNKAQAAAVPLSVEALRYGCADLVLDDMHEKAVYALRGVVVAPEGRKLVVCDWSAIEGRILSWHAGEHWKVKAFRDGQDCYVLTYRRGWGLPDDAEVDGDARQHGKVLDLSLGYEGGVSAILQMVPNYGVDPADLGLGAWRGAGPETREKAEFLYRFALGRGQTHDLSEDLYVKLECAKLLWRGAHPAIVQFWRDLRDAAMAAVLSPGTEYQVKRLRLFYKAGMLALVLPSGRMILYAQPRVKDEETVDEDTGKVHVRTALTYLAPYGGRDYLYGGKLANAATQGLARDIMAESLIRAETAGYEVVLHVYDEIVAEVDADSELNAERLGELMCAEYDFAKGLPLASEGFEAARYRK